MQGDQFGPEPWNKNNRNGVLKIENKEFSEMRMAASCFRASLMLDPSEDSYSCQALTSVPAGNAPWYCRPCSLWEWERLQLANPPLPASPLSHQGHELCGVCIYQQASKRPLWSSNPGQPQFHPPGNSARQLPTGCGHDPKTSSP